MNEPFDNPRERAEYWFVPLLGVFIALIIAYGIGAVQGREGLKRATLPHEHGQSASASAQAFCKKKEGDELLLCLQEQISKAEETARTEQDLTAQQQAAWGSMIGGTSALISLFATILGLVWIKSTLDATRETARAAVRANQISSEQSRGWLGIEIFKLSGLEKSLSRRDYGLGAHYKMRAAGNSPVTSISDAVVVLNPTLPDEEKRKIARKAIAARRRSGRSLGLLPGNHLDGALSSAFIPKEMETGTTGLLVNLKMEIWACAEYKTNGALGFSADVAIATIQLPLLYALEHSFRRDANYTSIKRIMD